jgi:endonuclease YncB( thermonuclease family)
MTRRSTIAFLLLCACSRAHAAAGDDTQVGDMTITKVVDGDTVRVDGLDKSLRLIGIDTEEVPHSKRAQRALDAATDFDAYARAQRGDSPHPVKMASPMGVEAKHFAEKMLAVGTKVRIERDDPHQVRDRYGRYLAYVFVEQDGAWVDYNVEAVRAGMSPYFTKYGYSRRFDAEFRAAEAEARAAHRGIWGSSIAHYPDYAERETWWNARADFVAAFEKDEAADDSLIDLADADAIDRITARRGREITVLSTVGNIYMRGRGPVRVMLSRQRGADFPIVFFDRKVFAATQLGAEKGELVRVSGVSGEYDGHPEIVVDRESQVVRSQISDDSDATEDDGDR